MGSYHVFGIVCGQFVESLLETSADLEESVLLDLIQVKLCRLRVWAVWP